MKKLLEENETFTQTVNDTACPPTNLLTLPLAHSPDRPSPVEVSPIYKPKYFFEKSG